MENVHECEHCGKSFGDRSNMVQHIKSIHEENSEKITCSTCFKSFMNTKYAKLHERRVHKKDLVECDECNETFDRYYLKSHIAQVHEQKSKIKCEICDKMIGGNKQHLVIHMKKVHSNTLEEEYKCAHCDKMFHTKEKLIRHIQYLHETIIITNVCNLCNKRFQSKGKLKAHQLSWHSSKMDQNSHKCHICDFLFVEKYKLQIHIRDIHEKKKNNIVCNQCDNKFVSDYSLRSHVELVHKNMKAHQCQECKSYFFNVNELKNHIERVHKKIKNQSCQVCGYLGFGKKDINKHIQYYHKVSNCDKTNECSFCHKIFEITIVSKVI